VRRFDPAWLAPLGGLAGGAETAGNWARTGRGLVKRLAVGLVAVAGAALVVGGAVAASSGWFNQPGGQTPIRERCVASTDAGSAALDPEQAANAALIAAVGQARGMSPRAVTIALAAAMQESKLRNIDYGDRDSLGLFQQRPSQDWGTPEQIMDPLYAAGEFYRELSKVEGFESLPITEAAQAVQRSGFPDAYAQHEAAARSFASALTGHSPGALTCQLSPAAERLTPQNLLAAFRAEWGDGPADRAQLEEPSEAAPAEGGRVALPGATATEAWAYAQWAVAKAAELGVKEVIVGERTWSRGSGQWSPASDAADQAPTAATVVLA
jgi:hypothetical protein